MSLTTFLNVSKFLILFFIVLNFMLKKSRLIYLRLLLIVSLNAYPLAFTQADVYIFVSNESIICSKLAYGWTIESSTMPEAADDRVWQVLQVEQDSWHLIHPPFILFALLSDNSMSLTTSLNVSKFLILFFITLRFISLIIIFHLAEARRKSHFSDVQLSVLFLLEIQLVVFNFFLYLCYAFLGFWLIFRFVSR
jgi:hypothetical protein